MKFNFDFIYFLICLLGHISNLRVRVSQRKNVRFSARVHPRTYFNKQPHFRVEPRVAINIPKMRLKVAMKLLSILESRLQVAKLFDNFSFKCKNWKN